MDTARSALRTPLPFLGLVLVFFVFIPHQAEAEEVGYVYESIPYEWIDTSGGTWHSEVDNCRNCWIEVPIGFDFEFYGKPKTSLKIGVNGFVSFGPYAQNWINAAMPDTAEPNDVIAPFWDDVNTYDSGGGGSVFSFLEGVAPNRRLTITWQGVAHFYASGTVTFQLSLYEGSNDIVFRYQDVLFGNSNYDGGASATVGVENAFGTLATQYSYNQALIQDQSALRFYPELQAGRPNYEYEITADYWIDTSGGERYNLCHSCRLTVPIGFNFAFYGQWHQELTLTMNGLISFDPDTQTDSLYRLIPDPAPPNQLIAVMWDAYYEGENAQGSVQTLLEGSAPNRRFTITWDKVSRMGYDDVTFQVTLYEGTDNIVMRYQDVIFGYSFLDNGAYATVGIEDALGELHTLYSYREPVIQDGMAVLYTIGQTDLPPSPPEPEPVDPTSYQVETIAYEWIETSGGDAYSLSDDSSISVALGFTFDFYGNSYSNIEVGSNGLLGFSGAISAAYSNTSLPAAAAPNDVIAPYWDDINPGYGGGIYTQTDGSAPNRRFTVTWANVPLYGTPASHADTSNGTFQATLYEGSNEIVFRYQDVNFTNSLYNSWGGSATVGIENADGTEATLHSYNENVIYDASALRFFRP